MEKYDTTNFLEYAYKVNKVKDLEEAFKEFDPKEEIHKGDAELYLKEHKSIYFVYEVGDIVFVREYYYENGEKGTNHLFVIIEQNNLAVPIENFGMLISSKIEKNKYKQNKLLKANSKNNLDTDSIVKTDALYKIKNEHILFKIGTVEKDKIEEYKKSFMENNKK